MLCWIHGRIYSVSSVCIIWLVLIILMFKWWFLQDGTVIVHTVKQGTYVRTLRPPYEKGWQLNIQLLALSYMGQISVYCQHSPRNSTGHEMVRTEWFIGSCGFGLLAKLLFFFRCRREPSYFSVWKYCMLPFGKIDLAS